MLYPPEIRTAIGAACVRAHHYEHDQRPIFSDPIAGELLTAAERSVFEGVFLEGLDRLDPALSAACADDAERVRCFMREGAAPAEMLARARYAEDMLERALDRGVTQYVLLGAGMDSFARYGDRTSKDASRYSSWIVRRHRHSTPIPRAAPPAGVGKGCSRRFARQSVAARSQGHLWPRRRIFSAAATRRVGQPGPHSVEREEVAALRAVSLA